MNADISDQDYWKIFQRIKHNQSTDHQSNHFETLLKYPKRLGEGYVLEMELRGGFHLAIENYQHHEPLIVDVPTRKHPLEFGFYVSDDNRDRYSFPSFDETLLCGSGMAS